MKPTIIIPIRQSDAWFSVGVKDGCTTRMPTTATLKVWKPQCVKETRACIGIDPCGNRTYRVTTPVTPSITLTARAIDCQGRAIFDITPAFFGLGVGRLEATLTACAGSVTVSLQVFSAPRVSSYEVGANNICSDTLAIMLPGGEIIAMPDSDQIYQITT